MESFTSFVLGFSIGLSLYFSISSYLKIRQMRKDLTQMANTLTSMSATIYTLTLALDEHKKEVDAHIIKKEKQILKG